jgi:hypothetical protein
MNYTSVLIIMKIPALLVFWVNRMRTFIMKDELWYPHYADVTIECNKSGQQAILMKLLAAAAPF